MRRLLSTIFGLLCVISTWAVKAYPFPVEVRQGDGSMLTVVLHGDEYFHYYTTLDDVLLIQQGGNYYVAATNEEGQLTATAMLAHNASERSDTEKQLIAAQDKQTFLSAAEKTSQMRRVKHEPINDNGNIFPHQGSPRVVVILAEFQDTTFSISTPKQSFDEYFNAKKPFTDYGNGETQNITSVRQYFKNVSFGQYTPDFDVYGPVKLPDSLKVYGGKSSQGNDERIDLLFQHACSMVNDSVDFSQYDINKDGQVDLVIVIYAGYSQSMSSNTNDCIWPKSGTTNGGTYDGKRVSRFAVSAELNGFPNCWPSAPFKRINGIGTLCHEFCHTLGLPDFYPTVNNVKGDNQAMEYWSLMDSGNYVSNGYAPVALNAWEREAFGWIEIPTLDNDTTLTIKPLDDGGTAYRILNDYDDSGHEYFIIENIQKIMQNYYQKGHGLVVYHVDYDAQRFSITSNSVNNIKGKPHMTVVPADGLLFSQYNVGKTIDGKVIKNADFFNQLAGDPFPGTSNVTELNDTMNVVNFLIYTGDYLNKSLENIKEEDGVVTLTFRKDFQGHLAGIETPLSEVAYRRNGQIYTLDGRRADQDIRLLPPGIYIQNGKKIVRNRQ
jgi:immune inhibitor A